MRPPSLLSPFTHAPSSLLCLRVCKIPLALLAVGHRCVCNNYAPLLLLLFPAMHNWEKSAGFYSLPPFSLPFLFSAASVSSEIVGDRETGEGARGGTGVPEVVAAAASVLLGVGIGGALQRKGRERGGKGRRRSGMREGGREASSSSSIPLPKCGRVYSPSLPSTFTSPPPHSSNLETEKEGSCSAGPTPPLMYTLLVHF